MKNVIITEDYVGFETAKLLKEKGFDELCLSHYEANDKQQYISGSGVKNSDFELEKGECISAPTLQMARKWLREKEIFVEVTYTLFSSPHKYQYSIFRTEPEFYTTGNWHKSYEEACEAAIKYCLENLI